MNLNHLLLFGVTLLVPNLSCKKEECNLDPNDQITLNITHLNTRQFPGLPAEVYVNTFIGRIESERPKAVYTMSNEQFFINGMKQNDLMNPSYKVGSNTLSYTADCNGVGDLDIDCPCGDGMTSMTKSFEVLDTMRIWIKKIEFWKQYGSPRPDVYLVINNFGNKSGASWNYDYANDGKKVWDINDTFTISKKKFNMSITVWDKDRVGKDELVSNYTIKGDEVNNWATGTQIYNKNGGFTFEIVRL